MRRWYAILVATSLVTGLMGCSTVGIYSKPEIKKENKTGVKFYYSKPYLLVTRTGAKDNPISVQIVYLPDLEKPQFAYYRAGWGSAQLNLELTNSILAKFGQTSDSKIPETLTAVGSLLGGAAGAFKTFTEAKNLQNQSLSVADLRAAAAGLETTSKDLKKSSDDALGAGVVFTTAQTTLTQTTTDALKSQAAQLRDPLGLNNDKVQKVVGVLEALLKTWDTMKVTAAPNDQPAQRYNGLVDTLKGTTTKIVEDLRKGSAPPPDAVFELYEIKQSGGKTELVRVPEPKP